MTEPASSQPPTPARKRRSDGERSRNAILREAAKLATVEGISGLSIGRLADAVGMSKSGLFAHFGSKQELQLATIETARAIFDEQVLEPALSAPSAIERLRGLATDYLQHVYPGVPGRVLLRLDRDRDGYASGPGARRRRQVMDEWLALLETDDPRRAGGGLIDPAVIRRSSPSSSRPACSSRTRSSSSRQPAPLDRARRAIERRLAEVAPSG